jgi:hypothetical protein
MGHNLFESLNDILKLDLILKIPNLFDGQHSYVKQKKKGPKKIFNANLNVKDKILNMS